MTPKNEAPHNGGASRNSCRGSFLEPHTLTQTQAQFLIVAYNVRPELAAMLAAFAFGGSSYNG